MTIRKDRVALKRFVSFLLCLAMCTTILSVNILTVYAVTPVTSFLEVTSSGMQDSHISFIVSVKPGITRFSGAVLNVQFDSEILEFSSASPVYTVDKDNNKVNSLSGEYVDGFVKGKDNLYSIAYMNSAGVSTGSSEYKSFYKITFKVKVKERPTTAVKFLCKELFTNDDINNDIRPVDGVQQIKEFTFSTLDNPKPLSTELLTNGIKFKWSAVDGAEEYTVLRKANSGANSGVWLTLEELTNDKTSYIDTSVESGVTYTYSVRCGNGYGDSGYFAQGVSQLYLTAATITTISNVNNTVRVMWGGVPGAEHYLVYRQENGSTEWQLLEKTASAKLYYEDSTVESGKTYKYAIAVENGNVSTEIGFNSKSHKFLGAPVVNEAKNIVEGIKLAWDKVNGAVSYEIYRKGNANDDWKLIDTTTSTSYVDKNIQEGSTYIYSLKTVASDMKSSFNTAVTVSRISATEIISVESDTDGVNVSWKQVNGADGYKIYRKARGDNNWVLAGTVGSAATSFKDTSVESGYYTYSVTATLNKSESLMSGESKEVYILLSPKNITVKNEIDGIKVAWNSSQGAVKYIVMRKDVNTGSVTCIGEPKVNYIIDKDAKNLSAYTYSVTAVDKDGLKSKSSAYTLDFYRVSPPVVKSATPETKAVNIVWDKVLGVDSYIIYRSTDGSWVKIGTASSDATTFKDTDVVSGVQYKYTVTAVKNNCESYLGDGNSKTATYVNMPSDLTASLTATGIKLDWVITDELSTFVVYKRIKGQSEWQTLTKTDSKVTTIHDINVKSGTVYEYAIRAISNDGTFESALSNIKEVIYLSKVETVKVSNIAGGVKVTWSKVAGAKNYIVYRRLDNGTWETLTKVDSKTTTYTDKNAVSNKNYYYTVRAEADGYRSAYQNYKIYYIAAPKITKFDSQIGKGITIKWGSVAGATQYYVYRKTGNSKWSKIGTTDNLLYHDKNVKLGTTYTYTVRANGKNVTSAYYSGWKRQYTPGTPTAKSITASNNSITLKWDWVTGADGYRVYRKANNANKWTQVANVKGTSYKDKNVSKNVKYTYTIRAYKGKVLSEYNKTGWYSAVLTAPTVKIANASTGVKVSWSTTKIATGYTVYRSQYDAVNKKWSSWKNMGTAKPNKSSWVDKKAQSGTTYRYTVRILCGNSKSPYKASNSVLYLKEPKVTISNATNGITVKWTQALQAKGYRVYRSQYDEATGKWSNWKNMGTAKYSKSSWTDKSVVSGVTYKYTVRTVSGKSLSSYTASASLKYLSVPQLTKAFKTADGIVVSYQRVVGADGYRIYRKTADTSWVQIDDVTGSDNVDYTDKTADATVEYIYTVRAYSGKSLSSYNKNGIASK